MLVRISAFELTLESERHDRSTFTAELTARSGQAIDNRTFYFDTTSYDGFCVGVIITVKDQSKFCKLESSADGKTKIRVSNLKETEQIMDFNFFALNLDNGIGIYQHYHQSAALSALAGRLRGVALELTNEALSEEESKHGKNFEKLSKSKASKLRKKCKTQVSLSQIVTQEGLANILAEYKKIKAFDYVYTVLTPEVRFATPMSDFLRKKREIIYFTNPDLIDQLAYQIQATVKDRDIKKGRVLVEDDENMQKAIKIFDMPEYLWEQDYDVVVGTIDNIDPGDFGANKYLGQLVKLFERKDYAHILQANVV